MIRRLAVLAATVAALASLAVPPAAAQGLDPNTPVSSDGTVGPAPTAPAALAEPGVGATGYQGVAEGFSSERGQPPRTLRAYWHVFIAFAVTWLLLFGYALALGRRWARLEREVLSGRMQEDG